MVTSWIGSTMLPLSHFRQRKKHRNRVVTMKLLSFRRNLFYWNGFLYLAVFLEVKIVPTAPSETPLGTVFVPKFPSFKEKPKTPEIISGLF
jgi:hypothetical protein